MGLLDDAIREHLDLKRRRGADPAEVERAEREALGPVRRGLEPVQEPGQEAEDATAYGVEPRADQDYAPLDEPHWDDSSSAPASDTIEPGPLTFESSETALDEPPPAATAPPAPVREPEPLPAEAEPIPAAPPPPSVAPPPAASEAPAAVPPPPAPAPPPPSEASQAPVPAPAPDHAAEPDPTGGETVEYDVERALDSEPRHEDEDVLDETPEFLQDTPDHDRLWFEQRPPRDFDFDG